MKQYYQKLIDPGLSAHPFGQIELKQRPSSSICKIQPSTQIDLCDGILDEAALHSIVPGHKCRRINKQLMDRSNDKTKSKNGV